MTSATVERPYPAVHAVVSAAFSYFQRCQRPDGPVIDRSDQRYLQAWDTVNALRAISLWRGAVVPPPDVVEQCLAFLQGTENPAGMLPWGDSDIGIDQYCTETTSEYVTVLAALGRHEQAVARAAVLRARQLPSGPWAEVHPHIPHALQTVPSVTGFAMSALNALEIDAAHQDEALRFLLGSQTDEGHFGINAYYCATHYYLLRPVVAVLMDFGCYAAVARARDFVLSGQAEDGSWFSTNPGYETFSSPELHTSLALETLSHAGMTADDPAVRRGMDWLCDRQRSDGSWYGGLYAVPSTDEYRELHRTQDVYTTAAALAALHTLHREGSR